MVRGILEPENKDKFHSSVLKNKKDLETHQFVTRLASCAGETFVLDVEMLEKMNTKVEEMDALE